MADASYRLTTPVLYHIRYAWHLFRNVPGMTLREAWQYPCDVTVGDGDPIEDARSEMSYMHE